VKKLEPGRRKVERGKEHPRAIKNRQGDKQRIGREWVTAKGRSAAQRSPVRKRGAKGIGLPCNVIDGEEAGENAGKKTGVSES